MKRGDSCFGPYGRLLWAPLLLYWGKFLSFCSKSFDHSCFGMYNFFFSLYNLFIPSSCTPLQPCLINPAWEHASHHPFTNSSLLKLSKVGMAWFFSLLCIFTTILPLPGMFFPPFPPGPMLSLFLFFIWTKEDGSVRKSPPNSYQGYEG